MVFLFFWFFFTRTDKKLDLAGPPKKGLCLRLPPKPGQTMERWGLKGEMTENPDEFGEITRPSSDFYGYVAQKDLYPLENFQAEARGIKYQQRSELSGQMSLRATSYALPSARERSHM